MSPFETDVESLYQKYLDTVKRSQNTTTTFQGTKTLVTLSPVDEAFLQAIESKMSTDIIELRKRLTEKMTNGLRLSLDAEPEVANAVRKVATDHQKLQEILELLCAVPNNYREMLLSQTYERTKTVEKTLDWVQFHAWSHGKKIKTEDSNFGSQGPITKLKYEDGTSALIQSMLGKTLSVQVYEPYIPVPIPESHSESPAVHREIKECIGYSQPFVW